MGFFHYFFYYLFYNYLISNFISNITLRATHRMISLRATFQTKRWRDSHYQPLPTCTTLTSHSSTRNTIVWFLCGCEGSRSPFVNAAPTFTRLLLINAALSSYYLPHRGGNATEECMLQDFFFTAGFTYSVLQSIIQLLQVTCWKKCSRIFHIFSNFFLSFSCSEHVVICFKRAWRILEKILLHLDEIWLKEII